MATIKQQKLAKKIVENYGKNSKGKPLGTIMKEVGYSDNSAKNPKQILKAEAVKDVVDPVVTKMLDARNHLLNELTRKGRIRTYKREKLIFVSTTLKNLTHDIQLLTGGQTENTGIDKYVEQLNDLAAKITAKKNTK